MREESEKAWQKIKEGERRRAEEEKTGKEEYRKRKQQQEEEIEKRKAKGAAVSAAASAVHPAAGIAVGAMEARKSAKEEEKLKKAEEKEERKRAKESATSKKPSFLEGMLKSERGYDHFFWLLVLFVVIEGLSNHTFFLNLSTAPMFFARLTIYTILGLFTFYAVFNDPHDSSRSQRGLAVMTVVFAAAILWPYFFTYMLKLDVLTPALYNILVSVLHPFLLYIFFVHSVFYPESPFRKYFIVAAFVLILVFGLTAINAVNAGSFDIPWLTPIEKTNFLGAWYSVIKTLTQPIIDLVKGTYYTIFGKFLGIVPMPAVEGEEAEKKAGIMGFFEKRIAFATGRVEEGAKKKLGVFLDELKQTGDRFYERAPVNVYSTLTAETLEGSTINVELSCKLDNQTNIIKAGDYVPQKLIEIFEKDKRNVECIFDNVPAGRYNAIMEADFGFETISYLKSYFVDASLLRSLRQANIDFFKHYTIKDRNPVAQSTSGPVLVGIGVDSQPLIVEQMAQQRIPLTIKLTNSWEGRIKQLNKVVIAVPKGVVVSKFYGLRGEVPIQSISCAKLSGEEQRFCDDALYNLYEIEAKQADVKEDVRYGAVLEVTDQLLLLGKTPPSIQYFKVSVQYVYSLKTEKSIEVERLVE